MKTMIINELLRLRYWLLVSLALLAYMFSFNRINYESPLYRVIVLMDSRGWAIYLAVFAFIFGIYQMNAYTGPSKWSYLINRPKSQFEIFLSLITAGLLILLSIMIPGLLIMSYLDYSSLIVIHNREYLTQLFIFLGSAGFYLAGTYARVSPYPFRGGILAGSVMMIFYNGNTGTASIFVLFPLLLIGVGWMLILCYRAFKPALSKIPDKQFDIILVALPIIFTISTLLTLATANIVDANDDRNLFNRSNPDSLRNFRNALMTGIADRNNYISDNFLTDADNLSANEKDALATLLAGTSFDRITWGKRFPKSDQLAFRNNRLSFSISNRGREFQSEAMTFSYDDMNFKSYLIDYSGLTPETTDLPERSFNNAGSLGPNGRFSDEASHLAENRFPHIPTNVYPTGLWRLAGPGATLIFTEKSVYRYDSNDDTIALLFTLPANEIISVTSFPLENGLNMLASQNTLYFFNDEDFASNEAASPISQITIPSEFIGSIIEGLVATTEEGVFLALLVEDNSSFLTGVELFQIQPDEARSILSHRFGHSGIGVENERYEYLASPLINITTNTLERVLFPKAEVVSFAKQTWILSQGFFPWLILLNLGLSSLLIYKVSGKLSINSANQKLWTLLGLLFGVPALLAFFVMNHWRDYLQSPKKLAAAQHFRSPQQALN